MGVGYRWYSLRRRLRTMGNESLLLRQFLIAGVLYLAVWGLVQVNLPLTNGMVQYIHWSVAEYKPTLSWEKLRSWGEESLNLPVLAALNPQKRDQTGPSLAGYLFPVDDGQVESRYGWRLHPVSGEKRFHYGIDIVGPIGTPVKAIASGYISRVGEEELLGKVVEIKHGNSVISVYGHLEKVLVEPKQLVKSGEIIATIGSSGVSSGPHLHLEIKERGVNVDPAIKLGVVEETPAKKTPSDEKVTNPGAEVTSS